MNVYLNDAEQNYIIEKISLMQEKVPLNNDDIEENDLMQQMIDMKHQLLLTTQETEVTELMRTIINFPKPMIKKPIIPITPESNIPVAIVIWTKHMIYYPTNYFNMYQGLVY